MIRRVSRRTGLLRGFDIVRFGLAGHGADRRFDAFYSIFRAGLADEALFPLVRALAAILLTKDHAIARQPARQQALIEQRIAAVFLAHEELTRGEMISSVRAAYIVRITPSGHLDRIFPSAPRRR